MFFLVFFRKKKARAQNTTSHRQVEGSWGKKKSGLDLQLLLDVVGELDAVSLLLRLFFFIETVSLDLAFSGAWKKKSKIVSQNGG